MHPMLEEILKLFCKSIFKNILILIFYFFWRLSSSESSVLPLTLERNERDYVAIRDKNLKKIQEAVGSINQWKFHVVKPIELSK